MATFTSFEDLGRDQRGIDNGLENPEVGGGGGGKGAKKAKSPKATPSVSPSEKISTPSSEEQEADLVWKKMNPKQRQELTNQFKGLTSSARKLAIRNFIASDIIAKKIRNGDPVSVPEKTKNILSREDAMKKLGESEREKDLKFLGYTPENSKDISKPDLDWAIATNTMYGDPLPRRVFGAPIEITENIGSLEYLLKENQALLEKMKTFDGSLEDAKKLIDEQYDLHLEIEGINKQIHDWKVGQQKQKYEKTHKVGEPPTNLPIEQK